MFTKASEYMANGSPIIIYSPEDTALVKYAKAYGWASIVTDKNTLALAQNISALMYDEKLRKDIAEKAKNLGIIPAQCEHSLRKISIIISEGVQDNSY